jgi:integrase
VIIVIHRSVALLGDAREEGAVAHRPDSPGAGLAAGSLRFHWLRHSFASSLISSGCSVKAVADAMGHGDPSVTLRLYASLWPGDDDRIRQSIEQAWAKPIADSLRTAAGQS